jgi:mRNA interferase RelE/StbE
MDASDIFYKIQWKKSAKKELKKINKKDILKILSQVESLSKNPKPANSKKLLSTERTYRIRVGNYRVLYSVYQNQLIIEIIRVGHRQNIYKTKNL